MPQPKTLTVTITAYRPIPDQTDNTPNWTSVDSPAIMGICAVSRDLLNDGRVRYGDLIEIPGVGVYKVMDIMNIRHKNWVDILVYNHTQEKLIGFRQFVEIKVLQNARTKVNS